MKLPYLTSALATVACIISACFTFAHGEYTVVVRTYNFSNPGSLLANGECCDYNVTAGDGSCAIPGCDHYFYYCLRNIGSTGRGCTGGRVSRVAYNDLRIDFSLPSFLGLPNPLPLPGLTKNWNGIQFLLQVYEYGHQETPELVQEVVHDLNFDSLSINEESGLIHFTNEDHVDRSSIVLSFQVVCGKNNYGIDCSLSCNDSDCGGKGQCVPGVNNYSCTCYPGYSGERCNIDINECNTVINPCSGKGECVDGINDFSCICDIGFTGNDCNRSIDDCVGVNCSGNGQCMDGMNNYTCVCNPGFTGEICDININECETMNVNCSARGVCQDGANGYSCICESGFTGSECEQNINDCVLGESCNGHGQCIDGVNSYSCSCYPGFTGFYCDVNVNECVAMNVSCSGRGVCMDGINDFACSCNSGFTGKECEANIDDCVGVDCNGHGVCVDAVNDHLCMCEPGYTAMNCDMEINECESLNVDCSGRGQCMDSINSYSCICDAGFTGQDCEVNINECKKMKVNCSEHGRCVDGTYGYTCVCDPGYIGTDCSTAIMLDQGVNEDEADVLQLQLIGGVFIGIVAFGLILICVFGILIGILAHLKKSHKGDKNEASEGLGNESHTLNHTMREVRPNDYVTCSEFSGGQWQQYDNPLYRDKSRMKVASSVRKAVNSEPIFDNSIPTNNSHSGSSNGLSNHGRSGSLEHEFDNPIYGYGNVRFNDTPIFHRISADLCYL